jgi:hypothetical protein
MIKIITIPKRTLFKAHPLDFCVRGSAPGIDSFFKCVKKLKSFVYYFYFYSIFLLADRIKKLVDEANYLFSNVDFVSNFIFNGLNKYSDLISSLN